MSKNILKKEKSYFVEAAVAREEKSEEQHCRHEGQCRRGGSAPGSGAETPLQAVLMTMVRQLCPWGSWRTQGYRDPAAACEGPHVTEGGCPKEGYDPIGGLTISLLVSLRCSRVGGRAQEGGTGGRKVFLRFILLLSILL